MNWFRTLLATDIPFARDDAHRLLPVMIACLMAFASLLLASALSINHTLDTQSREAIGMLQVEVPRGKPGLAEKVTDELKRTDGVKAVAVLTQSQMESLLAPWLGSSFALGDLPLPVILDVDTQVQGNESAVDLVALKGKLARMDTAIRVDNRGPWVVHIAKATTLLQALVILVALVLLACVIGMIVLVSKTNLKLHFKAVSLLHMFGATDEYILRQFQFNSAWLAARGAAAGVLVAAAVFLAGVIVSIRWQSPVFPEIAFTPVHVVVFLLLPLLTALIALVATRLTVQSMLEHMH